MKYAIDTTDRPKLYPILTILSQQTSQQFLVINREIRCANLIINHSFKPAFINLLSLIHKLVFKFYINFLFNMIFIFDKSYKFLYTKITTLNF